MKIIKSIRSKIKPLEGIFLFIIITLIIHYNFRYWAYELHYRPIFQLVKTFETWLADVAFLHTAAILRFMGYEINSSDNTITFLSGSWLRVNTSCSGFKQLLQAFLLFLFYPGRIKHKFWFIPLSMVLMYFANIFRLIGVALTLFYYPHWWEFSHDYIFRFVFYLILFLLWIWWEEKFRLRKPKPKPTPTPTPKSISSSSTP
jgi:exosortase/archaeosortase family protein